MGCIKILVAEENPDIIDGLCAIIDIQPDMKVAGVAHNGLDAIDKTDSLSPDVVLLDAVMPEMGGIEATPYIRAKQPQAIIFILTTHTGFVEQSLYAGADGCLIKSGDFDKSLQVIREALVKRCARL